MIDSLSQFFMGGNRAFKARFNNFYKVLSFCFWCIYISENQILLGKK